MEKPVRPKKSLGQHFLSDRTYCNKIVTFSNIKHQTPVIEIGPGTGQLTHFLLRSTHFVLAIEFDFEMIEHLKARFPKEIAENKLRIVQADILSLDWQLLLEQIPQEPRWDRQLIKAQIVGNLPYNIATRILSNMTEIPFRFQRYTLMTQKEVAERILADPGTKDYGYYSLLMKYHFKRSRGFNVPPGAFRPPPRVVSHVFNLEPRVSALDSACGSEEYANLLKLLQSAFRHRRKTLWNNLKEDFKEKERLRDAFCHCSLKPRTRPEEVDLPVYLCLNQMLSLDL